MIRQSVCFSLLFSLCSHSSYLTFSFFSFIQKIPTGSEEAKQLISFISKHFLTFCSFKENNLKLMDELLFWIFWTLVHSQFFSFVCVFLSFSDWIFFPALSRTFCKAGQEEYNAMRDQYLRQGQGFLMVYSIDNYDSFKKLRNLHTQLLRVKDESSYPIVLVGNKIDLEEYREVSTQEGQELANSMGVPFFEVELFSQIRSHSSSSQFKNAFFVKMRF
jgi:hypothetical protein